MTYASFRNSVTAMFGGKAVSSQNDAISCKETSD